MVFSTKATSEARDCGSEARFLFPVVNVFPTAEASSPVMVGVASEGAETRVQRLAG